jgi:predicted TPR repeat methyltransferase
LAHVIEKLDIKKNSYFDFACGTGRIISSIADKFDNAEGVDVSESMLAIAKRKKIKANLLLGDITKDPDIVGNEFNLITAFRFFLKAQEALRYEVIHILAKKLASDGILIFNIHNSRPSLLSLQNSIINLFRKNKIPSMSRKDVFALLKCVNLEIIEIKALGIIPKATHYILRPKFWCWLDKTLAKNKFLQRFGSDVIYICRKINK